MESPFKMRVFLLDNPGKENDYECKNFDEECSCKKQHSLVLRKKLRIQNY
jgi:hypothetical protein